MKFENLSDLRVIVEAARGGSLTAAARALEVTPAAASAMLKRLEAQVGVRLFERSTRALRLTEQGATLLGYAERALDLLDEGAGLAQSDAGALRGTVRVAAPADLSRVLLPCIDRFLERHPGVHVALSASDRLQDVRRDAVDLALRYGGPALPDSQLVARPLRTTRRVACAAPDYLARHGTPQHPADLAAHRCIGMLIAGRRETHWTFERERGGDGGRAPGPAETATVAVRSDRSVDDGALAHAWALAGGGIVYKSQLDVQASLESGRLVALLPGWLGQAYTVYAVLPSQRFVPARVRGLVEHLAQAWKG
ncbi:LysR family transcriptional regulator [Acidovorax sp. NCPPB 4044]|uniref:LysR family transcriptional regulator n=1 Tax=Acidovorax sp. NCPPB 4044 TaxID=2940490 RepID=UPI0023029ABD|nr:LysR family transcriptional regulator [Acidovorax sp. NCPPB 4044]MDA8523714.1 LysR family transcriptional regulator [Acidovorax sp. NCPPB 4044]